MIGEMRHRVTLQQPVDSADGQGGVTRTWSNVATIWAEVEPFSAREQMYRQGIASSVTMRVRFRYRSDVTSEWRFVHKTSRYLYIRSLYDEDERSIYMIAECEEARP